jgi:hypothetical protein
LQRLNYKNIFYLRLDLRVDLRGDLRIDLRGDLRVDLRSDLRVDLRGDLRVDLRRCGDAPLQLRLFGQLLLSPPLVHKFLQAQNRAVSLSLAVSHL